MAPDLKKILFILMISAVLLLSGCTESSIRCGVDKNNNAFLSYDIYVDLSAVSTSDANEIRGGLRKLAFYYRSVLGFEVNENTADQTDALEMHMSYITENENRADAMRSLKELLSDEKRVPFSASAVDWNEGELISGYSVAVRLDADSIISTAMIDDFPRGQRKLLNDAISDCTLTLELTLPATELPENESAELSDGIASKNTLVSFEKPTELTLKTAVGKSGDTPAREWLDDTKTEAGKMRNNLILVCVSAGLCFAAALVFVIVKRRDR